MRGHTDEFNSQLSKYLCGRQKKKTSKLKSNVNLSRVIRRIDMRYFICHWLLSHCNDKFIMISLVGRCLVGKKEGNVHLGNQFSGSHSWDVDCRRFRKWEIIIRETYSTEQLYNFIETREVESATARGIIRDNSVFFSFCPLWMRKAFLRNLWSQWRGAHFRFSICFAHKMCKNHIRHVVSRIVMQIAFFFRRKCTFFHKHTSDYKLTSARALNLSIVARRWYGWWNSSVAVLFASHM